MRRGVISGLAILVLILGGITVGTYFDQSESDVSEEAQALGATAATFPVPAGVEQALPDTVTDSPATAVRAWRSNESIEAACGRWRDAFRTWVNAANVGDVDGEVIQGQSCTLNAEKDRRKVRLQVAIYGSAPPQATLSVTN